MSEPDERKNLLGAGQSGTGGYSAPSTSPGVSTMGLGQPVTGVMPRHLSLLPNQAPPLTDVLGGRRPSLHQMSEMADKADKHKGSLGQMSDYAQPTGAGMKAKSYSVNADGSVSYLTPRQMGRKEMYSMVPFAAVFGLQKKERSLSQAWSSYAADLDTLEADQGEWHTNKKHLTEEERERRRSSANLLMLEELEMESVMVTTPLIFAVIVASASQFVVGYNTGVMNAAEAVVFPGHTTTAWSLAVSAFAVGAPFGAILAGNLAESRGRRGAMLINTWLLLLGGLLQTVALDMFTITAARMIIGLASGSSSVLTPIYLGEMAPPTLRGTLGTITQFALVIGILASDILAFPWGNESDWRYLFAMTPLICAAQLLMSPFLLESPRWLLGNDSSSRKARFIIKKLRGLQYDHEVEIEVDHYLAACHAQKPTNAVDGDHFNSKSGVLEMFADRKIRLLVVSAIVLHMGQQLCGVNAVFYYSNMFFEGVIDNPLVATTIVGAVNVVATYAAMLLMDSTGRRTLILWSSGGMFFSCIFIVLSLLGYFGNMAALVAVNAYIIFFEIGMGPIPWLIVAEMFDAKYVAIAMSVSCQINWFCNFIIGLIFPYMNEYLGAYSFGPFALILLGVFVFAYVWLPETQGTTPEELQAELIKRNASVVYHNLNVEAHHNPIDAEWRLAMEQIKKEEQSAMQTGQYNYGFQSIPNPEAVQTSGRVFEPPNNWQSSMGGK